MIKKTSILIISIILILVFAGIGFLIKKAVEDEQVPAIVLAQDSSDYLYQAVNIDSFEAKFGHKEKPQEIVFEKDGTQIKIFIPIEEKESDINWQIVDDRLEIKDQISQSEYIYSIVKDGQNNKAIGIKEEIILSKKPEKADYEFQMQLKGLTPRRVNGLWHFFDQSGKEIFFIPKPFMDDAQGNHSDDVGIQIEKQGNDYMIKIMPDQSWLADSQRTYPVIIDPTLEISDQPIQELKQKRTINSKFYNNQDGTKTMQAFAGYVHYLDKETGQFEDIDTTLWPTDYGWQMEKASYELEIPKYADQWFKFVNSAQIDYETGKNLLVPDEEINFKALNIKRTEGKLSTDPKDVWQYRRIVYKDAYADGIDLQFIAQKAGFDKLVVINEKPADLSEDLQFSFELSFPKEAQIKTKDGENIELWTEKGPLEISGQMLIVEKLRKTWFRNFKVWDSQGQSQDIQIKIDKIGDRYILTKLIDKEFLKNAVYPVMTDIHTETYYTDCAGGDDIGHVTANGTGSSAWDDAHNAADGGSTVICGGSGNFVWVQYTGGASKSADVARAFIPIDTSGITGGDPITAATLNIYVNALVGDSTYNVVQTTQPDVTTLTTADYDLCGATHSATVGATAVTPSATSWATFTLNATGRGWISDTSYTKLGIRDVEHDLGDLRPGNGEENKMNFDDDSTANDPYLEVTIGEADPPTPASGTADVETRIKGGVKIKAGVKFK